MYAAALNIFQLVFFQIKPMNSLSLFSISRASDPDSFHRRVVIKEDGGGFYFSGSLPNLPKSGAEDPNMICWGLATVCCCAGLLLLLL